MSNKGVPQGSVLGPLFFNVNVSSLHDAARAKNVSLPSFADDFTLYSIRPTLTEAADAATSALQNISILLEEKGLTISEEKTASMMIAGSFSTNAPKPLMYLNDSPSKMVSQAVLLGVTVDENLTWSAHIDALHRRICRKIGVLRRTMRQLTSASRRQFLILVIQPDFEYAAVAFVPSMSMSGKQRLLALWRKAVRCAAMADWRAARYCTTSRIPENQGNRTSLGVAVCSASASLSSANSPEGTTGQATSNIAWIHNSQARYCFQTILTKNSKWLDFFLAIEHL